MKTKNTSYYVIKKNIISNSEMLMMAANTLLNMENLSEENKFAFVDTIIKHIEVNNSALELLKLAETETGIFSV